MREIRSYGSVRGVAGDRYPYRDRRFLLPQPRSMHNSAQRRTTNHQKYQTNRKNGGIDQSQIGVLAAI
jgi:hypothetical protein